MMYADDPGVEVAKKAFGYTADCTARILRFILISACLVGCIFSYLVFGSCNFMGYALPPNTTAVDADNVDGIEGLFPESGSVGLFRYDPDGFGCRDVDVPGNELSAAIKIARLGAVIGTIFATFAFLMLLTEFVCCRFWCSRVLIVFFLFFAGVFQLLTFTMFGIPACLPSEGLPYRCSLSAGSIYSLVAAGLFFLTALLTCPTPKAIPLAQIMRQMEQSSVVDPCCCFGGRTAEEVLDENPELVELIEMPPETVRMDGIEYKQYYDSKAGVTLQDQYTAACKRWMDCEQLYDKTLDRFKAECAELPPSFLSSDSKQERVTEQVEIDTERPKSWVGSMKHEVHKVDVQDSDAEGRQPSWREVKKMSPEEIEDDDLRRLAFVLATQREQCDRAKVDMDRIQAELDLVFPQDDDNTEEFEDEGAKEASNAMDVDVKWWRRRPKWPRWKPWNTFKSHEEESLLDENEEGEKAADAVEPEKQETEISPENRTSDVQDV